MEKKKRSSGKEENSPKDVEEEHLVILGRRGPGGGVRRINDTIRNRRDLQRSGLAFRLSAGLDRGGGTKCNKRTRRP